MQRQIKVAPERVAYHEAGHAVIAWRLQLLADGSVTIVPNEDGVCGSCSIVYPDAELETPWECNGFLDGRVAIAFAGYLSEHRFTGGRKNIMGALGELANAEDQAQEIFGRDNRRLLFAYRKYMTLRVENMLADPLVWAAVTAVAEALLKHKTISAYAVDLLASAALTSAQYGAEVIISEAARIDAGFIP